MVDENRPLFHPRKRPVLAQTDAPQIIVIADTSHNEISVLRRLARGLRRRAAMLFDPSVGLGRGAVIDGYLMPLGL